MKYFFVTGRLPDLSVAELKTVFNQYCDAEKMQRPYIQKINPQILSVDTEIPTDVMEIIFSRLGGFVKFGVIIENQEKFLESFTGDITFGVSHYPIINKSDQKFRKHKYEKFNEYSAKLNPKKLANQIKKAFIEKGNKARFVLPERESDELNAAQIIKNKLLSKGFELNLIEVDEYNTLLVGQTLLVQDIDDYTKRDYDRPFADKEMGMLPPKLARIMLNLTGLGVGATIWDPFCGSGTILTEGLLNGYDVIGSDKDKNAIYFSEQNIKWLADNYSISDRKYTVFEFDVQKPSGKVLRMLDNTIINGIVFEPFMGPPQRKLLRVEKAQKLCNAVLEQYSALMEVIHKANLRNLVIVMVVPTYKTFDGWVGPRMTTIFDKKWECISNKFEGELNWSRSNSIIKRQIMVFKNKE